MELQDQRVSDSAPDFGHISVLYDEVLDGLGVRMGGRYIDGTLGSGGHTVGLLERSSPDGVVLGLDADPEAIRRAERRLTPFDGRAILRQRNFREMAVVTREMGWEAVDGILLDLGLSSPQLANPRRGFSFAVDGPLDMRFDSTSSSTAPSAAQIVNSASEEELSRLFFEYGEERFSRRIAHRLVAARAHTPIVTTTQLANLVRQAKGPASHASRIDPATQVFQALRIAVNDELGCLAAVLPQAINLLHKGGRLAIIAFHSLEDRLVKQYFRQEARSCICPSSQLICTCAHSPSLRLITKGALQASPEEIAVNRRARSARLRIVERV